MKTEYAQAFFASIKEGVSPDAALSGLRRALERKNHGKLYAPVLLEVLRTLETRRDTRGAVVLVAKNSDTVALKEAIASALKELGATDTTPTREVVDETVIGGFVATYNFTEKDHSYKKALKSLYESIVK